MEKVRESVEFTGGEIYDRFQKRFSESDPVRSGVFALNRYFHLALEQEQKP